MSLIGKSAIISRGAKIDSSVQIGEFTVVGTQLEDDNIIIGAGTSIYRFCFIDKNVSIGQNCIKKDILSPQRRNVMKAVIYARYSSDNQTEASIEGQLRECLEFAGRTGTLMDTKDSN